MRCLHCGWCCINFEIPELNKRAGERCKYLTSDNLCLVYDKPERPEICSTHDYPAVVCPIGLQNTDSILIKKCELCGGINTTKSIYCNKCINNIFQP
jgi:hypothetical protein